MRNFLQPVRDLHTRIITTKHNIQGANIIREKIRETNLRVRTVCTVGKKGTLGTICTYSTNSAPANTSSNVMTMTSENNNSNTNQMMNNAGKHSALEDAESNEKNESNLKLTENNETDKDT